MNIKFTLFILVIALLGSTQLLYAQEEWVNIEKKGYDNSIAYKIGTDSLGNIYMTGSAKQASFDTNAISITDQLFVAKFSSTGQNLWIKPLGTINNIYGKPLVSVMPNGEILISARYNEAGETILGQALPAANAPVYAAKLDKNGALVWIKQVPFSGFQYQETYVNNVDYDAKGNCYINFSHGRNSNLYAYAIITKLDSKTGDFLWEKIWQTKKPTQESVNIRAISVDLDGNLYATGDFINQLTAADTSITDNVGLSIFVVKYDSTGKRQWMRLMKSERGTYVINQSGTGIAVSKDGKTLYSTGEYSVSYNNEVLTPQYLFDGLAPKQDGGFISKMDPATGRFIWVRSVGEAETERMIKIDSNNDCYFRSSSRSNLVINDSIPLGLDGLSGYYGLAKVDKTGKFSPIVPIGEGQGLREFDIYKNRLIFWDILYQGSTLYFESGATTYSTNRPKLFLGSMKLPTGDFSIKIDSIRTSGECFKKPIWYKLKTSTFRANNQFVVQMSNPASGKFEKIYLEASPIKGATIDTFSRLLNAQYYYFPNSFGISELDSASKIRICSTNPVTCSSPFSLNNPKIGFQQINTCLGDTIKLSASNALTYEWSPTALLLDSKTLSAPRTKPDTTTDFKVNVTTKLGCTTSYTQKVKVVFMKSGFLKDTAVIPCDSPDDIVNLEAGVSSTNSLYDLSYLMYQWQPSANLSSTKKASIQANPLKSTKYFVSIIDTFNKCIFKDSVLVKVDPCKIIYGKTNRNNIVEALVKKPGKLLLEPLKSKVADSTGNYFLRLPQTNVYLQTRPPFKFDTIVATYFDSVVTMQKARLLTHLTDTLKIDFYALKIKRKYTGNRLKGTILDFYDPTLAVKNLDLLLVDTNIYKVLKGQLPIDSLDIQYSVSFDNGKFEFSDVKLGKPYLLWVNRLGINNEMAPRLITYKMDEPEKTIYFKDSILINCSDIGSPCGTIAGKVFNNIFGNECAPDFLDGKKQQIVKLEPINIYAASDSNGRYLFRVPPSSYTLKVAVPNHYIQDICTTNGTYTNIAVTKDTTIIRNFGFRRGGDVYDYATELTPTTPFRPGFETDILLNVRYLGNRGDNSTVTLKYPQNKMVFKGSNLFSSYADTSITGEIKFRNIFLGENFDNLAIKMQFRVLPTARLGDSIIMYSDVMLDFAKDSILFNNKDTLKQIIVGSFDPNDKEVEPAGNISTTTENFTYTIRFQNTGTDTAFNIVVRDTLSESWNPMTIKNISSSHPFRFIVKEKNIVEWRFDNILLVDSFHNEKASHGFVKFSIKPLQIPLSIGAKLQNKAAIYFDYNSPIITNTATNTVVKSSTSLAEIRADFAKIYPNPANTFLAVDFNEPLLSNCGIEMYNSLGQLVQKQNLTNSSNIIAVDKLKNGVYIIKLYNGLKTQSLELVIQR